MAPAALVLERDKALDRRPRHRSGRLIPGCIEDGVISRLITAKRRHDMVALAKS